MDSPPRLTPVAREFLRWVSDDYCEAFLLRDILKRQLGMLSPEDERRAALDAIRALVIANLVVVGDMKTDTVGLSLWNGSAKDLASRLERSWKSNEPPRMGEGPWFDATDQGRKLLQETNS